MDPTSTSATPPDERSSWRGALAAVVLLGVAGVAVFTFAVAYSFAETYGADLEFAPVVAAVAAAVMAGLLFLARRLVRWARPPAMALLAGALLLAIATAATGTLLGDRERSGARQAAATACDGAVGTELEALADASGRVVLQDDSKTRGNDRGECIAYVNATPDDVVAAARSLGWEVASPDQVVSPSGIPVTIGVFAPEPNVAPAVELTAGGGDAPVDRR